ncbi:Enkurin domain-containing protein 1 [Labeo rohita]|uniref:Enkurin domain-containing protein 1 n=1 Tax=Labeo rohita TaxID=84645 RepID=A0ABQ8MI42_LABRO|nr:Enkurin domain-containing protein 1 [Labeo rohita]
MCEGPSAISGPIPPDPTLFPEYYKRPFSARGRLEGNAQNGSSPLLKGPLAPDPGCYSAHSTPRPRIGANAAHILERGQRGRFRELEAQREHAKPMPVKALWISPKYQDVPSRVMAQLQNFLKAHSVCGAGSRLPLRRSESGPSPAAGDSDSEMHVRGHTVDFVSHNARAAGKTNLRRSQSLQNLREKPPPSAVKGKRKLQWKKEEEEKRRNTPDPSVPAGHTQMSERERQETLQSLKETHRSLVSELLSLPVKADTMSVRSRRTQLDQRLSEVEEAIKIFSREKVYVKVDS